MADPVSWFVVEPGWTVLDRDGKRAGTVDQVLGDEELDIFDGLAVSTSTLGAPRYVPSERVRSIVDGGVHLDLTIDEVGQLDDYKR